MPWIRIPAATITLQGEAVRHQADQTPLEIQQALLHGLEVDRQVMQGLCIIQVIPRGRFLAYGVGVSLITMRKPEEARGRAPV